MDRGQPGIRPRRLRRAGLGFGFRPPAGGTVGFIVAGETLYLGDAITGISMMTQPEAGEAVKARHPSLRVFHPRRPHGRAGRAGFRRNVRAVHGTARPDDRPGGNPRGDRAGDSRRHDRGGAGKSSLAGVSMNYDFSGRTGMKVSEVSFGAWAIGSGWGPVDDKTPLAAMHKAVDLGVNFFDTADVYGTGRSEKLIGQLLRERSEKLYVATKAGRKLSPHVAEKYTLVALRKFVEESLATCAWKRSICSSSTVRPPASTTCPNYSTASTDGEGRQAQELRRERGEGGRGPEGHRVPRREDCADHLQHVPPAPRRAVLPRGQVPLDRHHRARAPGQRHADGQMTRTTRFQSDDHRALQPQGPGIRQGRDIRRGGLRTGPAGRGRAGAILPAGMTMTQFALRGSS